VADAVARYDTKPVPRGTSHRWEVLISDEAAARPPARRRTAIEVQPDHRILHEVPDAVLRDIPLLDEGARLERRQEYLDFHDPAKGEFRAEGGEVVRPGQRVVARADVSDEAWRELRDGCERVRRRRPLRRAG
jgi:hypothetical protein